MSSILHIDLETQNHLYYGKKASPYCPDNYIVLSGYRVDTVNKDGTMSLGIRTCVRYNTRDEFISAPKTEWLPIPDDCWLIVAHNAAYEISWFLTYARESFEAFIRRGGRVYCTMHGEYLASDQTDLYPSLDDTAVKYGGTHKVDGVKILWEQGVLTSDIDPDLLSEYLIGDEGDIANTAKVFYGQTELLRQQGKFPLVWERMDAMLAFAYCEWFGMYVNMSVAQANRAEQEARILELKSQLAQYLPEFPADFTFNFNSLHHMSAWIYGGTVSYDGKISYDPPKYEQEVCYGNLLTEEFIPVSNVPELSAEILKTLVCYQRGKNVGMPKVFKLDTLVEKLKKGKRQFTFQGLVDIEALPQVVKEKYKGRGEFVTALLLADNTPVYSTSGDAMAAVARLGNEFANTIVELAALEKDTGTYYLRNELNADGTVKKQSGMLQYVIPTDEDGSGIIHHSLNTCATATGRLSSSTPNLQNLPRDGTSKVKQMFTSRFGKQGRIIEVDYSALEVVMGCVHTGDTKLLKLLQDGTDMHCYRLAFRHKKLYEDVYELCHNQDGVDYKYWKQQRTDIKPPSFAAQYGATARGIAFATGLPEDYCQEFLDNEAELFPKSIEFRAKVREEVVKSSQQQGMMKRERCDDGSYRLYRIGYWTAPSGMRYQFREKPKWDSTTRSRIMDFKDTELANYWCQGEAFFMMAVAFGMLIRHLIQVNWYDGQVCLVTNVHDAVYLDAANAVVGRRAALDTQQIMETARERILKLWPNYGILSEVQFPAAAEMGINMMEKTHVI